MNISPAILPFVNVCQISNRMANSPESLALSASSPRSPEYVTCPFEQALHVQTEPASLNVQSLFATVVPVKGFWSEKDHQVQCQTENKTKKAVKIKIEHMARHDQTELNIRVGRSPKQNTVIDQHTQWYPEESNHMSSILLPVYTKITEEPLLSQTFSFLVWLRADLQADLEELILKL